MESSPATAPGGSGAGGVRPSIFVSYAHEDRDRVAPLARALEDRGWSVWWDRDIPVGKTFDEVVEEQIDAAAAVIAVWSDAGVESRWVRTEAAEGYSRGVLVPVLLDDVRIPLAFRRIQAADLRDWTEGIEHDGFEDLVDALEPLLAVADEGAAPGPAPPAVPERPSPSVGEVSSDVEPALDSRTTAPRLAREPAGPGERAGAAGTSVAVGEDHPTAVADPIEPMPVVPRAVVGRTEPARADEGSSAGRRRRVSRIAAVALVGALAVAAGFLLVGRGPPTAVYDAGDGSSGLELMTGGDVDSEPVTVGVAGEPARSSGGGRALSSPDGNTVTDHYLQFDVADDLIFEASPPVAVTIEVEYLDEGTSELGLEYDARLARAGVRVPFLEHDEVVTRTDSGEFRTATFDVEHAFLGNGTNGGDFRFFDVADDVIVVRRVVVVLR